MTRKKILVVDDDGEIRSIFADWLQARGYQVFCEESGRKAFEFLMHTKVDLVLSDVSMTDGTGFWLLRLVKVYEPTIPVILMSANAAACKDDAKRHQAFACEEKRLGPELLALVKQALGER